MSLDFFTCHNGKRALDYPPQPELEPVTDTEEELDEKVDLRYEAGDAPWQGLPPEVPSGFVPITWPERPQRFVDGKDRGEIVATLRSPQGYPIPVRLSQIGAAVLREQRGHCRRIDEAVERVVTLIGDPFAWHELEGLAAALQARGLRLLLARLPKTDDPRALQDFEVMRKATQNRSNDEMAVLEESVVGRDVKIPTLVDGPLEKRSGRCNQSAPLIGVIKTQRRSYLNAQALETLYQLEMGRRTPAFLIKKKFPVVSFYLRLAGGMPSWGLVRVEVPQVFFEQVQRRQFSYIHQLAHTLYEYRCRQESYGRAPVSLHPIVRVEQSLGALFCPMNRLINNFYRIAHL